MRIYVLWLKEDDGVWRVTPYRADRERDLLRWVGRQRQKEGKCLEPYRVVCRDLDNEITAEEEL